MVAESATRGLLYRTLERMSENQVEEVHVGMMLPENGFAESSVGRRRDAIAGHGGSSSGCGYPMDERFLPTVSES